MGIRSLILGLSVLSVLLCGCQGKQDPPKKTGHGVQQPVANADMKDAGMVAAVKKSVFDVNKSKAVGKAIDDYRYFTGREWKETKAQNGTIYVDFIGVLDPHEIAASLKKDGVVARSVNLKFVIKPGGTCFVGMITLYDTRKDGVVSFLPVTDVAGVMNAIYANAELPDVATGSDSP